MCCSFNTGTIHSPGQWEAMSEAGRERSGKDVIAWMEEAQELGAGELLLTSIDQDGTCAGPDRALLNKAAGQLVYL